MWAVYVKSIVFTSETNDVNYLFYLYLVLRDKSLNLLDWLTYILEIPSAGHEQVHVYIKDSSSHVQIFVENLSNSYSIPASRHLHRSNNSSKSTLVQSLSFCFQFVVVLKSMKEKTIVILFLHVLLYFKLTSILEISCSSQHKKIKWESHD